jgi:DNA-binding beta-propeller fold protein YncE
MKNHYFIVVHLSIPKISVTAKWVQNGITVAGGYGNGNGLNQMNQPYSTYVDDDQTIYVADQLNHRIVEWKKGATDSRIVAGENGAGNRTDQLNQPVYVIIDRETDCLLISDTGNRRVMRWPRRNSIGGETILSNAKCWGLALDNDGYIYVTDVSEHAVIRYGSGGTDGTVVAGGNGKGDRLNQLNGPFHIFVDQEHSVYVSDRGNHRVMKWVKDAKEGIVVAGGQGQGNSLTQLSEPFGLVVDYSGTVYVADRNNYRVMRWLKGATQGSVVVGGNGHGGQANQFKYPCDLSFDRQNNLYVVDCNNHRVQKFNIETNSTM